MRNVDPGNFNTKIAAARREAGLAYVAGVSWLMLAAALIALIARFA